KLIWAAGITGNKLKGLQEDALTYGNRIKVDNNHKIQGLENVYAIGDIAYMENEQYEYGHPQVAQVAIQQARNLAKNFKQKPKGKTLSTFEYKDKGSMATIGRNKAVVDLPSFSFNGNLAWFAWLAVHLFAIIGVKNKIFIFLNWLWNYLMYNQSLRLIIRPYSKKTKKELESS
ncbi:MAG: FAD-dependent oxidoreductase, partial [Bacteroidota bacterium]